MRRRTLWTGFTLAAFAAAGLAAASGQEKADDLVVHEWGTFLAMSGSDGAVLEGMYHEEHALPAFVHARSREQLRMPSVFLKGETPVIYFYTDRPQSVGVDVRFPRGVWTQWYPQAQVVSPPLAGGGQPRPGAPHDGRIFWSAELLPASAGRPEPAPPATSSDALWNFAREVDAAFVRTTDRTVKPPKAETDRFLFYRGLGEAVLPLRVSADGGGTLELDRRAREGVRHVFVVRVENGRGSYRYLPRLEPGDRLSGVIPDLKDARALDGFSAAVGDDLVRRLKGSGLFEKEARAMVNTWRASYFQGEGVRVLFVLPQTWTDRFIPLTVSPTPREVVRVMVGRVELLTPGRERLAGQAVRDLTAPDPGTRQAAFDYLRGQGRYVEPILRRVERATTDERLRTLCKRLLATGFVTELRAAVHGPSDGRRLREDPAHVRAQLALLLREVGLVDEAKAEGRSALAVLKSRTAPRTDKEDARHALRAFARASEAVGDDREAADGYGRFIRFGSQVATKEDCRGCHEGSGPQDLAWFRGWWAGERYAALLSRAGTADRAIADYQAALKRDPSDVAARLSLAYLLERSDDTSRADALWAELGRTGRPALPVAAATSQAR